MFLGVLIQDLEQCTGCGLCMVVCSAHKLGRFTRKACINVESYYNEKQLVIKGDTCDLCLKCSQTCPTGALQTSSGFLSCDENLCTECGQCLDACPKNIIRLGKDNKPVVCDLCKGKPQCIDWCPRRALSIGVTV